MRSLWQPIAQIALVLLTAGIIAAQPSTTTFTLTGPTSYWPNLAGVVTSPYYGTVYTNGPTVPVICDDFADDSFIPEQWNAYVTSLSDLLAGTWGTPDSYLKWGGQTNSVTGSDGLGDSWSLTQDQAYEAAAVLAIGILQNSSILAVQQEYSFALWELFDSNSSGGAFAQLANNGDSSYEGPSAYLLMAAVNDAKNNVGPSGGSLSNYLGNYNVTIYSYEDPKYGGMTPKCGSNLNQTCSSLPPQEFITVSMAEPFSPALLSLDLLGVVGVVLFARRRSVLRRA